MAKISKAFAITDAKISFDSVAKCSTVIAEISKSTTAWDVIETALQKEYKATGIRHAVVFDKRWTISFDSPSPTKKHPQGCFLLVSHRRIELRTP